MAMRPYDQCVVKAIQFGISSKLSRTIDGVVDNKNKYASVLVLIFSTRQALINKSTLLVVCYNTLQKKDLTFLLRKIEPSINLYFK